MHAKNRPKIFFVASLLFYYIFFASNLRKSNDFVKESVLFFDISPIDIKIYTFRFFQNTIFKKYDDAAFWQKISGFLIFFQKYLIKTIDLIAKMLYNLNIYIISTILPHCGKKTLGGVRYEIT